MNFLNLTTDAIISKLLMLPGIIIGLSFHEFAHAWVSDRLGDPTPRRQGRVTLSPAAHIDPVGFIALLLVGFGWGKPVQIDPRYYKNPRRDEFMVGIAGVTMNLILAVIFALIIRLFSSAVSPTSLANTVMYSLYQILIGVVVINLVLMIFNLIPCPPLDGWGLVTQIFRLDRYDWWYRLYQSGTYILLALIIFNVTDMIITPVVNFFMGILL